MMRAMTWSFFFARQASTCVPSHLAIRTTPRFNVPGVSVPSVRNVSAMRCFSRGALTSFAGHGQGIAGHSDLKRHALNFEFRSRFDLDRLAVQLPTNGLATPGPACTSVNKASTKAALCIDLSPWPAQRSRRRCARRNGFDTTSPGKVPRFAGRRRLANALVRIIGQLTMAGTLGCSCCEFLNATTLDSFVLTRRSFR